MNLWLHANYSSFFHLLIYYLFLWPHAIPPLPAQAHVAVSLPWIDSALTHRVVTVCVISPVYSCVVSYNLAIWSTAMTSFNLFHLSVSTELVNFDLEYRWKRPWNPPAHLPSQRRPSHQCLSTSRDGNYCTASFCVFPNDQKFCFMLGHTASLLTFIIK